MNETVRPKHGAIEAERPEYLARQLPEEVLEPKLRIIDAHHHLWDIKGDKDPLLGGRSYRYLLDEFVADAQTGHNVVASVFVECHAMYRSRGELKFRPVGEVEFAAGMAAMSESGNYGTTRVAAAIVGQADLTLGNAVAAVLEAQIAVGGGRFRGVRHSAGWSPDPTIRRNATSTGPGVYLGAGFKDGLRCLTKLGLSLDALLFYSQLDDLVELARAVPDSKIILCHCGTPLGYGGSEQTRAEVFLQWKAAMNRVASCPNVNVKLGGMTVRLAAYDYRTLQRPPTSQELATLWKPYIETCIELFGAKRCMFESNFPVEKMGVPYKVLWNAFKRITAQMSADEKEHLFSATAARSYRIDA